MVCSSPVYFLIFQRIVSLLSLTVISLPIPPISAPRKNAMAPVLHSFKQDVHPQQSFGYLMYALPVAYPLGNLLVEESRAIGLRMGRNLAIGWNRIVYEFCQAVSLHLISALCIGFHTVESIAHDDASHSLSFLIS